MFSLLWEFDLLSVVCFFGDIERYFNMSGAVELSLLRCPFSRLMTIQNKNRLGKEKSWHTAL